LAFAAILVSLMVGTAAGVDRVYLSGLQALWFTAIIGSDSTVLTIWKKNWILPRERRDRHNRTLDCSPL